jgi:hypothetical protein
MAMAEETKSTQPVRAISSGIAFKNMTQAHKIRWSLKLVLCVLSFGFIFPNVMSD